MPVPPALTAAWPHVRAAFVAFHVLAVALLASPDPGSGMRRSAWKDATVQAELTAWAGRLGQEPAELEETLWQIASRYMKGRQQVLAPARRYARYTGADQSWQLFVAPHRYPARLHIDLEEGGQWRPLFVERSREYTWKADLFDEERFRSALFRYSWKHYRGTYKQLAAWAARQAAAEFPQATALRTRWYRFATPTPEQVREDREPEGKFEQVMVLPLDRVRAELSAEGEVAP